MAFFNPQRTSYLLNPYPALARLRAREPVIPGRSVSVVYFKHYDGELLWGATARMTLTLLASLEW